MIKKTVGNVTFVRFGKQDEVLTKGALDKISKRVDEINEALDLCGDRDDDVRDVLDAELEVIEKYLEKSLEKAKKSPKKKGKGQL